MSVGQSGPGLDCGGQGEQKVQALGGLEVGVTPSQVDSQEPEQEQH